MHSRTTLVVTMVSAVFAASVAFASVTFVPPTEPKKSMDAAVIKLMPQRTAPKASGMAMLASDQSKAKCVFSVEAKGLDPKKVYTVWLTGLKGPGGKVDAAKMQGFGGTLKVDAGGHAKLATPVGACTNVLKWQKVEIIEHTSGNPKDMKKIAPVLIGDVTQFK